MPDWLVTTSSAREGGVVGGGGGEAAQLRLRPLGLADLQQRERAQPLRRLGEQRGLVLAERVALPGEAAGDAEGAAREQAIEAARGLRRLEQPGHVVAVVALTQGCACGPERAGGPPRRGADLGPRGRLEVPARRLDPAKPPGREPGEPLRLSHIRRTADRLLRLAQRRLVLAAQEQRARDLGAQARGIGWVDTAGRADRAGRAGELLRAQVLAHAAVECRVAREGAAAGLDLLGRGPGRRQLARLRQCRQRRAARRAQAQQAVDARRVRVVGIGIKPSGQLRRPGARMRAEQPIGDHMADQQPVGQPGDIGIGGRESAVLLGGEDAAVERCVGRAQHARQAGHTAKARPWHCEGHLVVPAGSARQADQCQECRPPDQARGASAAPCSLGSLHGGVCVNRASTISSTPMCGTNPASRDALRRINNLGRVPRVP